jgi:hypothetical protein
MNKTSEALKALGFFILEHIYWNANNKTPGEFISHSNKPKKDKKE